MKLTNKNRLSITHPELCKEWDYIKNGTLKPSEMYCHSHKKVWWVCDRGHKWIASVDHRSNGRSCPYCAGQRVCVDNCLATIEPEISKEWNVDKNDGLTPYDVTRSSHKNVWWQCHKGHEWQDLVYHRVSEYAKYGCPCCSGRRVAADTCLAYLLPHIALEWHPTKNKNVTPHDVTCYSNKKAWWICKKCRHEWISSVAGRSVGNGCPACTKIKLKDGTVCDSVTEAYLYLKLTGKNIKFLHNKKYGGGNVKNCRYDFYIPKTNTYIEVTSFSKKAQDKGYISWVNYLKKIVKKKQYVESIGANFRFIQLNLNKEQIMLVRVNTR